MNLIFKIITLVCFSVNVLAQGKQKVIQEFGGKVGMMYLSFTSPKAVANPIFSEHELLYRLHFKKDALRLMFSSWNKRKDFSAFGPNLARPEKTINSQKDFFGAIGYQRHMEGKAKNLYLFTDLHYTNFTCSGLILPLLNVSYSAKCIRIGTEQGIGYKFQVFECVNICPELFLNFVFSASNFTNTSVISNRVVSTNRIGDAGILASARLFISFEFNAE